MVDGEDGCAHNNKGNPLRVHRSHSILKEKKTKRRSHKEHQTRNDVRTITVAIR